MPTRWPAQQIKARLDKGEDFAAIAKAESDDTASGQAGAILARQPRKDGQAV